MVLALSGGGSGLIPALLTVPGASHTVLEAVVPYARSSMDEFLARKPDQYCSSKTARQLAVAAFQRACRLTAADAADSPVTETSAAESSANANSFPDPFLLGLGLTASLASDVPKRGDHRFHLALQTATFSFATTCILNKEALTRSEEENLVVRKVLEILNRLPGVSPLQDRSENAFSLTETLPVSFPEDHETEILFASSDEKLLSKDISCERKEPVIAGREECVTVGSAWSRLFWTPVGAATVPPLQMTSNNCCSVSSLPRTPRVIMPGAFNPVHRGHCHLIQLAGKRLGLPVELEITVHNVDKSPPDYIELDRRLKEIRAVEPTVPVWLTNLPRFYEKAEFFAPATFIIGADTVVRIAALRYYENNFENRQRAFARLAASGARFLVFARRMNGVVQEPAALDLPEDLKQLCDFVPSTVFLDDISSTEIREKTEGFSFE